MNLLLLVIVIVNDFLHDYVTIECNSLPATGTRVSVYISKHARFPIELMEKYMDANPIVQNDWSNLARGN